MLFSIFILFLFPSIFHIKIDSPTVDLKKNSPNGLTANTNGLTKLHNQPIAINLSTSDGISPALLNASNAAMPLNLNINAIHSNSNGITSTHSTKTVNSNGLQIISNHTNTVTVTNGKNGIRHSVIDEQHTNSKEQIKKLDSIQSSEPPTKVIKLINSNGITLASVDKDSKNIPPGQLTLSQVVVSQIPLLTPTQTLRVIGQGNGVATIELSNSNGKNNFFFHSSYTDVQGYTNVK